MAGGSRNPRALNGVSAYGGTFSRATSSEFSGTWNVTGLVAKKANGSFYSTAELAGTGESLVQQTLPLSAHKFVGVVQHAGESGGPVSAFRSDSGGQMFMFDLQIPTPGLLSAHKSAIDPANTSFASDVAGAKVIGQVTALIPEASTADQASEHSVDGQSGDTDFPYADFKALATVGEYDPNTGLPLTGYPDGQAAWLADEDTVRVAYQSESYAKNSNETYPWVMSSGATFTGSHIHAIDYNRAKFADFLENGTAASEMFEASEHLFDKVYNVFGDEVTSKASGGLWGNAALPNGTQVNFASSKALSQADFFFHSFCGSHHEKANKYGTGKGFADDIWLMAEEWNLGDSYYAGGTKSVDTMGLASMVVDTANGVAYTVPALGQSGYEKLLPVNPGTTDHVVIVCAGYNYDLPNDTAPMRIYVGKKGLDAQGVAVDQNDPNTSARDKFLARNGLLYGKVYGMALANASYATLNLSRPNLTDLNAGATNQQLLDNYVLDTTAPNTFSVRYYPTTYKWNGWGTANAVSVANTEATKWFNANEQPTGYTFFPADDKVEHPAVDPDITKFRFVQNLTNNGALLGIEFTNLIAELTASSNLPDYVSADVRRIIGAENGSLTLETGGKGIAPTGTKNSDGTKTAAGHVNDDNKFKMVAPDGLQWIKTADADVLIVDEDSGNAYGERKYALVLNPQSLELAQPGKGWFLAMAGGTRNPRAINGVSAYGGTFKSAANSEFSGSWNVTGLVAKKANGSFYSTAELAGTGESLVEQTLPLSAHKFIGVVQHLGESGGPISAFRCDYGGQMFMFKVNFPTLGGKVVFDPGTRGSATGGGPLEQSIRAGQSVSAPTISPQRGWIFAGWDQQFDEVNGNIVTTAQYVKEASGADYGLYTPESILDLRMNGVMGAVTNPGSNGTAVLGIKVESGDLSGQWTTELTEQVTVPAPAGKRFYRLNPEQP